MVHRTLEFTMPASSEIVFDAFHFHAWRHQWDSLVNEAMVIGGHPCPYKGAITENRGGGWMGGLSMRTQFVTFDRPKLAAAAMLGSSFPFSRWAASMKHRYLGPEQSLLIYTYTFDVRPAWASWVMQPIVERVFLRQTRKRFNRLRDFLHHHAADVRNWQAQQADKPSHSAESQQP